MGTEARVSVAGATAGSRKWANCCWAAAETSSTAAVQTPSAQVMVWDPL